MAAAAAPGKKKKKKGEEDVQEVILNYLMVIKKTARPCVQEENEREVPISEMDLFGQPAMNNAYLICHNIQVYKFK